MTTVGLILYFGGLLVPVCYLLITRFRGPKLRVMIIGFSLQLALTLILFAVSEMDFQHGNTEAYHWGLLVILVNLMAVLCYWWELCSGRPQRKHEEP